ncbi:hypothetical protein AX16_007486 [Volvariella volvacea WC 439]|nr:hypothetical protein AX16_007486 [Volvariella volvacea WC 439]
MVMPEVGDLIAQAIMQNPSILKYPLEAQWNALIIKPLCQALKNTNTTYRALVVIDGLDECEPCSDQQELLRLLPTFYKHNLHRRVAFLLASRPESHIESEISALMHDHSSLFRLPHLMLSETEDHGKTCDSYSPHHSMIFVGAFIYVLTIVRWLPGGHPIERLDAILGTTKDQHAQAFTSLDLLYSLILKAARRLEILSFLLEQVQERMRALELELERKQWLVWEPQGTKEQQQALEQVQNREKVLLQEVEMEQERAWTPWDLSRIFGQEDCGYIRLILQPLHSVIRVPESNSGRIEIYHTFSEYLHNSSRSGLYYAGDEKVLGLLFNYDHLGFEGRDRKLGTVWLSLPLKGVRINPDLTHALTTTRGVDWLQSKRIAGGFGSLVYEQNIVHSANGWNQARFLF